MRYNRLALRAQVTLVRDLWIDSLALTAKRAQEKYDKDMNRYREVGKPKNLEILKRATDSVKKDQSFDLYSFRNEMVSVPKPPAKEEASCHPTVSGLNVLLDLLDTVNDDEITATALSRAGVKDVQRLLRKPC